MSEDVAAVSPSALIESKGGWEAAASMSVGRSGHAAVTLHGKWIMVGGAAGSPGPYTASIESYDPATNTWTALKPLSQELVSLAAASDETTGRIAVTGGILFDRWLVLPTNNAEIGPPDALVPAPLHWKRHAHTLTFVAGVFVAAGGWSLNSRADLEIYETDGHWTQFGSMPGGRPHHHTATALKGTSRILFVGGIGMLGPSNLCNVFDVSRRAWRPTLDLHEARVGHQTEQLKDGRVLVTGGQDYPKMLSSAEIYDPTTNAWSYVQPMRTGRYYHMMTVLPDGRVLVAGGSTDSEIASRGVLASTEIYDPTTDTWIDGPTLKRPRVSGSIAVLDNAVYVAAGSDGNEVLASVERLPLSAIPPIVNEPDAGPTVQETPTALGGGGSGCHVGAKRSSSDGVIEMSFLFGLAYTYRRRSKQKMSS